MLINTHVLTFKASLLANEYLLSFVYIHVVCLVLPTIVKFPKTLYFQMSEDHEKTKGGENVVNEKEKILYM